MGNPSVGSVATFVTVCDMLESRHPRSQFDVTAQSKMQLLKAELLST